MKVYILTKQPFPFGMAATNRIIKYAQGLCANGVDCEIITAIRTERVGSVKNEHVSGVIENGVKYV